MIPHPDDILTTIGNLVHPQSLHTPFAGERIHIERLAAGDMQISHIAHMAAGIDLGEMADDEIDIHMLQHLHHLIEILGVKPVVGIEHLHILTHSMT